MDSINTLSDSSALASVANLLSSLGGVTANDSAESKLFADFLNQNQNMVKLQTAAVADGSATTVPAVTLTGSSATSFLQGLKKLTAAWNSVLNRLHNQTEDQGNSQSSRASGNGGEAAQALQNQKQNASGQNGADPQTVEASNGASTPSPVAASAVATGNSTTATDGDTSDTSNDIVNVKDPKVLAKILSELQILAQLIAQQLQQPGAPQGNTATASAATGATAGADASTTDAATGSAGGSLSDSLMNDLKAFAADLQKLETGLGNATSATAANASAGAAANSTTDSAALLQSLSGLLSLAQDIARQLDKVQNPQAGADTATNLAANTGADNTTALTPLTFNVQSLLTTLKGGNGATSATGGALAAPLFNAKSAADDKLLAAAKISASGNAAAADAAKGSTPTAAVPTNVTKNAAPLSDPFLNSLSAAATSNNGNAVFPAPAAVLPVESNLTGSDGGNASFDMKDQQESGAFPAASTNAQADSSNLPSAVEQGNPSNPYSFASQLAATKGSVTGATGLPPAVEQVMLQLNRSVKGGNDQMTLQLNPADLGRVNIKLDIATDGKVQGTVVADNPQTLHLLLKDVRSLERALQDAGLRADPGSLQFNLGNGQSGQSSGQMAKNGSRSSGNSTTQDIAADIAGTAGDQAEIYYVTPGRVNLKV